MGSKTHSFDKIQIRFGYPFRYPYAMSYADDDGSSIELIVRRRELGHFYRYYNRPSQYTSLWLLLTQGYYHA